MSKRRASCDAPSDASACARALQRGLKAELRHALATDDGAGCWARIQTCAAGAVDDEDTVVRLEARNGAYYAFHGWRYYVTTQGGGERRPRRVYLLHEGEFAVEWVRDGCDATGLLMRGRQLEGVHRSRTPSPLWDVDTGSYRDGFGLSSSSEAEAFVLEERAGEQGV